MKLKRYRSKYNYSYTLGMAPTVELLLHRPNCIVQVYIDPRHTPGDGTPNIMALCKEKNIPYTVDATMINRVATKGNVYVLGVFHKFDTALSASDPHILLVNPSDSGNLGTILRTGLGFGFTDIGIITPAVDHFHPSTIRASMGALFASRIQLFSSPEEYRMHFPTHDWFSFMLEGAHPLKAVSRPEKATFSLVFGNESTGLPASFLAHGSSVYIPHSTVIDSLNLSIAVGIGLHHFSQ